ncbi:MAG: M3 family metallopeptidase [Acidobacteriota bacterium]|nr:M3 family metallopeptidase [Acidobacteriota bacterium]MDH3785230.1 M3 family metallopeptidase [Acidobacteriota bacterium]
MSDDGRTGSDMNILLAEFAGPYDGVPAFDRMDLNDVRSALTTAIDAHLEELDAVAANSEPANFENTIVAMERAGETIGTVFTYWGIWSANRSSPEFREIQREMNPRLSEYQSKIIQNDALFRRIKNVYESDEMDSLSPSQRRLVWLTYDGFASNGATLDGTARERYAEINKRLSDLQTQFSNNVLADEENYVLYLNADQLGGLSKSFTDAAAAAATERDQDGAYAITNTRSSMEPFLTTSSDRALREKVWRTYFSRGDNGDEFDNNAIISEILRLRHERVQLLGYETYAHWRLQNRMAREPQRALDLMEAVWPAALGRVQEEVADMQAIADADGAGITIEPWDYRYYAERVRQAKYDLDFDEVKQYLQMDRLVSAMHYVAGELFDFEFTPVPSDTVPVFHEDMSVYEVTRRSSGERVGLWYLDPYARQGKRSGAWATSYRRHESFDGERTVLSANNSNFIKGAPGQTVLISWTDATTLFHEFGHALHSLSSQVAYPTLNGGLRDYTEFQSQLLERWLLTDRVIESYLTHHETGEPMPAELVAKIRKAATFNQGFSTVEYLASALMDMRYHMTDPAGIEPDRFERETLKTLDMPKEIVMRHRSPHFGHIFSSEGYSAGYYSYLWADVLTSDAAEAFVEAGDGFYDADLAAKLVEHLFAIQNAVDPADAYREFRGRDAGIGALMRDRGFPVPARH